MELHFIKEVEDGLVFSVDCPVLRKPAEEAGLGVMGTCHLALWKVHDAQLQELIRGLQAHNLIGQDQAVVFTFALFFFGVVIVTFKQLRYPCVFHMFVM